MAPLHEPVMADLGRLGQAGRARGIDVECGGIDRRGARIRTPAALRPSSERVRAPAAANPRGLARAPGRSGLRGRRARTAVSRGARSAPTIKCPRRDDVDGVRPAHRPPDCVLTSATTTPMRVKPSQIARYSAQFAISSAHGIAALEILRNAPARILIAADREFADSSRWLRGRRAPAPRRIRAAKPLDQHRQRDPALADGCGLAPARESTPRGRILRRSRRAASGMVI